MSQTVSFEIPKSEVSMLEALLDKTLAELRYFGSQEDVARQHRIEQAHDEIQEMLRDLKRMNNVEENL